MKLIESAHRLLGLVAAISHADDPVATAEAELVRIERSADESLDAIYIRACCLQMVGRTEDSTTSFRQLAGSGEEPFASLSSTQLHLLSRAGIEARRLPPDAVAAVLASARQILAVAQGLLDSDPDAAATALAAACYCLALLELCNGRGEGASPAEDLASSLRAAVRRCLQACAGASPSPPRDHLLSAAAPLGLL